jgi:glutamine amidotransferase-like uncharacterized protein
MISSNIQANNKYVYLYTGQGTGEISRTQAEKSFRQYLGGRSAKLIPLNDPSYFQNPARMPDAEAIVFPGGNAVQINNRLGDAGIQGIKSLVNDKKASYIGFCAGGYLAARTEYTMLSGKCNLDFELNLSGYSTVENFIDKYCPI